MKKLLFVVTMLAGLAVMAIEGNIICSKAQNIRDQWSGILPGRGPVMPLCTRVVKDEPFTVNIFFGKPAVKDGKVKVSGELTMLDPKGKVKFSTPLQLQEFECANPNQVFLFPGFLMISFDPPDAFGSYSFKAVIKDEVAGTEKVAEAKIELLEKNDLPVAEKPMNAMTNFYSAPAPQNILPAFKEYLTQVPEMKKKQGQYFNPVSLLAVFYHALTANPQIWPEFAEYTKTLDGEELQMALLIVSPLKPEFHNLLPEDLKKRLIKFSFNVEKPEAPWQLDVLWSEFLITGRKAPVMKIAEAVNLLNGGLTIEKYKEIENPTEADRQALISHMTGRAAAWSLNSNAKQHKLVAEYLECALARKEFKEPFTAMFIGKMLSEMAPKN